MDSDPTRFNCNFQIILPKCENEHSNFFDWIKFQIKSEEESNTLRNENVFKLHKYSR